MTKVAPLYVAAILLVTVFNAQARGGSHGYSHHSTSSSSSIPRDTNGHIKRSTAAKNDFKASNPCPSTGSSRGACPGYVIDHVQPLKRGGADAPSNMQWQTKDAAKEKDKWE